MIMHRFDSFEESPPPPPHPHSHHTLESNVDFSPPPNSRETSGEYCSSTLPLTINGGPNSPYVNDINIIPFCGPNDFVTSGMGGYGGSGVIIGSGGVITTASTGMESLKLGRTPSLIGGTLGRNGNSISNIKRSSMLDLTITNTANTNINEFDSAGPTDTILSHSNKHPLPEDDLEDQMTQQLHPHHMSTSTLTTQQHHYTTSPPHQHTLNRPRQNNTPHHQTHQHQPLTNPANNNRGHHFQSSTRLHRIANKHGLNKKGLVLLMLTSAICILLLVSLAVLGLMWPREGNHEYTDVCLTPDCLRASAQLQGSLSADIPPCSDFWQHSCGGWLKENPIPVTKSKWDIQEQLKSKSLAQMRASLDTMDEPRDSDSIEWKLRTFYWSCMNMGSYLKDSISVLRRIIITELHGWYLLRDTWDLRRWDFDNVLTKLHAEFGVSPFFRITVVPDPKKEGSNIIKLMPAGFSMPHRSYYDRLPDNNLEKAFNQYVKDTVKMFEASGPDAIEFASHHYFYESRIAEITPTEEYMNNPAVSNVRISIGVLGMMSSSIQWLDLLRNVFPSSKLDHRTEVLVVSQEYFSDLSKLISTTDRSQLNNYLIFSFVSYYLPYLPDKDKRVLDLYRREFTGAQKPLERWEFCIKSTSEFFSYGLGSLYERTPARLKYRDPTIKMVTKIFNQIRRTFTISLAHSRWYPMETKARLSAKLSNMSIAVGYPDFMLDRRVVDDYYKDFTIFTKDFFKNLRDSILNGRRHMEKRLLEPLTESPWMVALTGDDIVYVHQSNKVVIPPFWLNPPYFHPNYPAAMLFGGIGVRIAREMLRAFDSVGLSWDSHGHLVTPTSYTNRTLENLQGVAECVAASTSSLSIEDDNVIQHTAADTAAELDAVRQTFKAYLSLLKREPQPQAASFENLNNTNIFYLSYAGSLCTNTTVQREDIERTCGPALMGHPRLDAVLAQLPEFAESFQCDTSSPHYPSRVCTSLH